MKMDTELVQSTVRFADFSGLVNYTMDSFLHALHSGKIIILIEHKLNCNFSDRRFYISTERLMIPESVNVYFADFYCNSVPHYVIIYGVKN